MRARCGRVALSAIVVGMTETAATPPADSPLFVRPREGRIVAGVCAGIAQRWGFDLTLVRVLAVVVTIVSGAGLAAYVAAWLLTPSTEGPAPLSADSDLAGRMASGRRRFRGRAPRLLAIVIAALLVVAVVHSLFWWTWGWGVPVGLCVAAVILALVIGTRGGRWLLAAVLALLLIAVGAVAAFGSHFGTRTYHVSSVDDLRSHYDYGAGKVDLDLSALTVSGRHETRIRVGRGDVSVTVPSTTAVVVHGHSGLGAVTIDGHEVSGFDSELTQSLGPAGAATADDRLVLDATVGVGDIDIRSAPAS